MDIQAHRRDRLEAAAQRVGGKAALGRLLGYVDGAYIGQMLRGERPVKEDTVAKIEAIRGMAGWFDAQIAAPAWPFALVSQERWALLNSEERGMVQGAMNHAIEECEQIRSGKRAGIIAFPDAPAGGMRQQSSPWKKGTAKTPHSNPQQRATDKKGGGQ